MPEVDQIPKSLADMFYAKPSAVALGRSDWFACDAAKDSSYGSFSTASLVGWMVSRVHKKQAWLGIEPPHSPVSVSGLPHLKRAGMQYV